MSDDFEKALKKQVAETFFSGPYRAGARWAREWLADFYGEKHLNIVDNLMNLHEEQICKLREENERLNKVLKRVGLSAQMVDDMALLDELKAENERLKDLLANENDSRIWAMEAALRQVEKLKARNADLEQLTWDVLDVLMRNGSYRGAQAGSKNAAAIHTIREFQHKNNIIKKLKTNQGGEG